MYLCLMVAVMPFLSCSSDDDDNGDDPITAEWKLTAEKEVVNGEEVDLNISNCRKNSSLQFYGDGMAVVANYSDPEPDDTVTCKFDGSYEGTWENRGNNTYAIKDENGEERTGEFTFEDNKMTVRYSGDDGVIISIYTMVEDY
ncbi:lipocalin family protein [Galbibacter sp. EGI 63066]|uniref:lipocalin family protein n=1 Tax=Galbibacter sp. EGI 63066 TaxID=2993559 RepID=UPI0022498F56|nr:lipocalin family protein [Galbibacter sp. EGI 63066]MCX2681999.1 lipocalin family protein [Galbibacter sp. EGI 63066]